MFVNKNRSATIGRWSLAVKLSQVSDRTEYSFIMRNLLFSFQTMNWKPANCFTRANSFTKIKSIIFGKGRGFEGKETKVPGGPYISSHESRLASLSFILGVRWNFVLK